MWIISNDSQSDDGDPLKDLYCASLRGMDINHIPTRRILPSINFGLYNMLCPLIETPNSHRCHICKEGEVQLEDNLLWIQ